MSDVEVDDVFCVSSLHTDRERFTWVEGEGHKATSSRRGIATQDASIDLELE